MIPAEQVRSSSRWTPEGEILAVLQIVHGIAEHIERYDEFASFLNAHGVLVVGEDHMGHGGSAQHGGTQGYFDGGWDAVVTDTVQLLKTTKQEFPDKPYFLFGHSMGSFLSRTILCKYPDLGLTGCVICGTGWMPDAVVHSGHLAAKTCCAMIGERTPSKKLEKMTFGGFNKRVEHQRTDSDWLTRDSAVVDAYLADPRDRFTQLRAAAGHAGRYDLQPENRASEANEYDLADPVCGRRR